jgi:ATP-dependent DNA helicase RecG
LTNGNQESDEVSDQVSDEVSVRECVRESARESNQESNQEGNQESNYVSDQESYEVTADEKTILRYCLTPKSRAEILGKIGLSNQTKNYKRHIETLLGKDWLKMTIPENPKNRNQKHVTTESGNKMLGK